MREKINLLGEVMNYIIVVFRARTETLTFANILKNYGVPFQIINTPRSLNLSCGISVKTLANKRELIDKILSQKSFQSFLGVF